MLFHVYVDWTDEEFPRAFYVGKGRAQRVHLRARNRHHVRILNKYGMTREVAFTTADESLAFAEERRLIAFYKTRSHGRDGHWGANHTDGGEGLSGHTHSDETRQKMADAQRGDRNHMYGRTVSEATRHKMSEAHEGRTYRRGHRLTDEHKHKIGIAGKGRVVSEDTRQKLSTLRTGENNPFHGQHHDAEALEKIKMASTGANNPMYGRTHSEETRRRISEACHKRIAMRKKETNT